MSLSTIFQKPVDRHIEGVIKADDETSLRLELEEYVLTNEVQKRLESFLDAYKNYAGANGVWISGFFGSGKSHLLKMLALILENKSIDGAHAADIFLPKCQDNEILKGDLELASSIPSKSILFNIDQKADVISKTQIDALLAVFVKVFDETCGYYGKLGYIAKFERDLDSRGQYDTFKTAYQEVANQPWEKGREQALLEDNNIAMAFARATGGDEDSAKGILDRYRKDYRVSIEDFAEQVNDYLSQQPSDFRLNFFVDEVGQYIANNTKLMTNLQTIAESLATRCKGRAWIIVTSQNDMSTVLGEMNQQQSNDFSKIMARFANKMLLTSTNVAEVIQKRLLSKREQSLASLTSLHDKFNSAFGTLFGFTDGSREYKTYRDLDEFINCYPFVPYQFELFQAAIENLSSHNAFEGKHSSVGERSMLGVFQQVAMQIGDHELGQLATFDLMYEGLHTALKSQTQTAVLAAERQVGDQFAIRVLKALFLVKYVKEFKATTHNICVLMLESLDSDLGALKDKVQEALNLLEQQTYIQRNGDVYEFLTDEEKDVEQEIKNTEVESTDLASELEKIIFEYVIRQRKIRDGQSEQDFSYSRKLDDRLRGREHELEINVITPFHDNPDKPEDAHRADTVYLDEVRVFIGPDTRLFQDLTIYKQTEKYIRQNISTTQQDSIKRILENKGHQNRERLADLQSYVQQLLGRAKIFVAGAEIESNSTDAQTRVIQAFYELVSKAYPNLRILRGFQFKEDMVKTILEDHEGTLLGTDTSSMTEAEQEIFAHIQSNARGGVRTTIKSVLEKFERKPYGWDYPAIICNIAYLSARNKVELRSDSNLLDGPDLEQALKNTHGQNNIVLVPQAEFTASQIRALKEFFEDFFDAPPQSSEAKALGTETSKKFGELSQELTLLHAQAAQYPFLRQLEPELRHLSELADKPYTWQLTELPKEEDKLFSSKEQLIDPIRKFMAGSQKEIYDEINLFLQSHQSNFAYLDSNNAKQLHSGLVEPDCFKGNHLQELKALFQTLKDELESLIRSTQGETLARLDTLKQRMQGTEEYGKLPEARQAELDKPFQDLASEIQHQHLIAVVNDTLRHFEDEGYRLLLQKMDELLAPPSQEQETGDNAGSDDNSGVKEKHPEYVKSRSISVSFPRAWLASEGDVEEYLKAVREAYLEEISKGKRIQI